MTQIAQSINMSFGSMSNVINNEIAKTGKIEKKIFYILIAILFILFMFYGYFVNQTIHNIVKRESMESEIKVINSNISELELKYLSIKNNLTLDYAYSIGFLEAKKINYISKKSEVNNLTFHGGIK